MTCQEFFQFSASSPQELRNVVADYLLDQNNESLANSIRLGICEEFDGGDLNGLKDIFKIGDGYGSGLGEGKAFGSGDGSGNGSGYGYGHGYGKGHGIGNGSGE